MAEMGKKDRLARLHYYASEDDIRYAVFGEKLKAELRKSLTASVLQTLEENVASLFYRANDLGYNEGLRNGENKSYDIQYDAVYAKVRDDIVKLLDGEDDDG